MQIFAQKKDNTLHFTQKDLVGTWQRNSSEVLISLGQNFEFHEDSTFVLNLSNNDEDVRNIVQLKGLYSLVKDRIHFTIKSRTVMDGQIKKGRSGIDGAIFYVDRTAAQEIPEKNPPEQAVDIIVFSSKHISINNEEYYKIGEPNDTVFLTEKAIVGTWQQGYYLVGDGLNQNFVFHKDGTFVLNMGNGSEDARIFVGLKGKYRIVKDAIYFTINTKIINDGKIDVCDAGLDFCIFTIRYGKPKEIPDMNPQELEPCYITVFDEKHIKINNEEYFKIDEKDLQ